MKSVSTSLRRIAPLGILVLWACGDAPDQNTPSTQDPSEHVGATSEALSGTSFNESLFETVKKCDEAAGFSVPAFDCDKGTEVTLDTNGAPVDYFAHGKCDYPNHLNRECDPGSRFQVLRNDSKGYVVAHCRKKGAIDGGYNDVAVIQHNKLNGATCFYQSDVAAPATLGTPSVVPHKIRAPSDPSGTEIRVQQNPAGCTSCHNNGPIIRSPYLAHLTGPNTLPGAGDDAFNRDQKYRLVGNGASDLKIYKVDVGSNLCTSCHRMGTTNGWSGGAGDFAMRAVEAHDVGGLHAQKWDSTDFSTFHKHADSSASPLWMTPNPVTASKHTESFNQSNADAAQTVARCAKTFGQAQPAGCSITQYSGPPMGTYPVGTVMWLEAADAWHFMSLNPYASFITWPDQTSNHNNATSVGALPSIGSDAHGSYLKFAPVSGTCQKMQVTDSGSLQLGTHDFAVVVVADYNDDPNSLSYMVGKQLQSSPWRGFGLFGSLGQTGDFGGQLGSDYEKAHTFMFWNGSTTTIVPSNDGEAPGASGPPRVFVMRRVGNALDVRVNGLAGGPAALTGVSGVDVSAPGAPVEIGCRNTATHPFTGRIYSVGVIRDTVDDTTLGAFEAHLKDRYHLN